jgi:hypothetical protein
MADLHVHIGAENTSVEVGQCETQMIGFWQVICDFTTQWIDIKVTEHVWEITLSTRISNKQGVIPEQWDHLIDCWVIRTSDLESNRILMTWKMAVNTTLDGQKLKPALDLFA